MAVNRNGKNTPTGKIGNVVVRNVNGQTVTSAIGIRTKPFTEPELNNQDKMKLINHLHKPVKEFMKVGFHLLTVGTTLNYQNIAVSINNPGALKLDGAYPEIDYSKAVFSKGNMPAVEKVDIQVTDEGLEFKWDPNWKPRGTKDSDRVMLLAYCPEKGTAYFILDGYRRSNGKDTLEIMHYSEKVTLHTYVAFIAADRKSISTSVYTGEILY